MILQKALFSDLDGTIITTQSGRKFPIHSQDWKFIPETLEALSYFYDKGFKIIIVSNQGGIEQGYMAEAVFTKKIEEICKVLEKRLKFKAGSVCYSYCKELISYNRKPNPGMAFDNALEFELDLRNSVMLGNYKTDEGFSTNAGLSQYIDIDIIRTNDWTIE